MLNHVIVPLDGSQLAESALDYAVKLLGEKAQITLVTVIEPQEIALYDFYPSTIIPKSTGDDQRTGAATQRARNYLKQVADDLVAEHNFHVTMRIEIGDAATLITDIAEHIDADAIVMSTHGRSGLSRWLFGSVTQKVLSATPCPVYVIPAKTREELQSRELAKKHTS